MDQDQFHIHGKERPSVSLVEHFAMVAEVDSSLAVVADSNLAVVAAADSNLAVVAAVAAADSNLAVVAAVEQIAVVAQVGSVVARVGRGVFELEQQVEEGIAFFQQLEKK